jgi:hypothetical protein
MNIEAPNQFYKYIGSDGNQEAVDVVIDEDDNIYVLGKSSSTSDGEQLYVVKTTAKGEVLWERVFGDAGDEVPKDIELLNDGDLVLVADRTDIGTGEKDIVIYRLNSTDGSVMGTPRIDGYPGIGDYVNSITEISDGFVVAAYSDNGPYKDFSVFRYDASFSAYPGWSVKTEQLQVSGGYDLVPVKVFQIHADLFYTFCYTNSIFEGDNVSDYNYFIHVSNGLNDGLNELMIHSSDPISNERLTSVSIIPPQSGSGFIMAGYISNSSRQELYLVRIRQGLEFAPHDPAQYLQGAPKIVSDNLSSIVNTKASVFSSKSQGFLVLGNENALGNENIFLTKVDNELENAWQAPHVSFSLGGAGNDTAGAVVETSTGRIVLCGTMVLGDVIGQKKVVLMNLSPNGLFVE